MVEEWDRWLRDARPKHQRLTSIVESMMKSLIAEAGIDILDISGRTKPDFSVREKIKRKNYNNPANQLTDFTGLRIVTYFDSQVRHIESVVKGTFQIDEDNSLDQGRILGSDRIGYRSVHFVCKLGSNRGGLPEYRELGELPFEIQVRTVLQHAWAELAHDRAYKFTQGLPTPIQRKLNLYSGMLEIVDMAFDEIAREVEEYKREISTKSAAALRSEELNTYSVERFFTDLRTREEFPDDLDVDTWRQCSAEVLAELKDFGIQNISDLQDLISGEFISACNKFGVNSNIVGTIRDAMMHKGLENYLSRCKPMWAGLDHAAFKMLCDKYGSNFTHNIINEYGLHILTGIEED